MFSIAVASKYRKEHSIRTLHQVDAIACLWDDEEKMMSVRHLADEPNSEYHLFQDNPLEHDFFLKEINVGNGIKIPHAKVFTVDHFTFIKSFDEESQKFIYMDPEEGAMLVL